MKFQQYKPYIYAMLAGFGAISLSVLFFFVLYRYQGFGAAVNNLLGILEPFIYGGVIAYLLKPVCNTYDALFQKHLPKPLKKLAGALSITLGMITGFMVVYILLIMIVPQLWDSLLSVWGTLPGRIESFMTWLYASLAENEELVSYSQSAYNTLSASFEEWMRNTLTPWLKSLVGGVGLGVMNTITAAKNLIIGLFAAVYLLASRKRFGRQAKMVLYGTFKPAWADLIMEEVLYADRMFGGFINGKILDSAIIGVLCYIGCLAFKFPTPLLISAIVGITNVIPFFGPFIGAIPSTILIMLHDPIKGLWFVLFVLVLQQLDGNFIGPKILGNTTGLSSFWVLFAILLFGGLWGFVGMIVGVPLFAVIYDVAKKLVMRGLYRNKKEEMLYNYHHDYETPEERAAEIAQQMAAEAAAQAEATE